MSAISIGCLTLLVLPYYVSEMTAQFLMPFKKLPWVRAAIIGQPPNLMEPFTICWARAWTGDSGMFARDR